MRDRIDARHGNQVAHIWLDCGAFVSFNKDNNVGGENPDSCPSIELVRKAAEAIAQVESSTPTDTDLEEARELYFLLGGMPSQSMTPRKAPPSCGYIADECESCELAKPEPLPCYVVAGITGVVFLATILALL